MTGTEIGRFDVYAEREATIARSRARAAEYLHKLGLEPVTSGDAPESMPSRLPATEASPEDITPASETTPEGGGHHFFAPQVLSKTFLKHTVEAPSVEVTQKAA